MKLHHFDRPMHFEWLARDFKDETGADLAETLTLRDSREVPLAFGQYVDIQQTHGMPRPPGHSGQSGRRTALEHGVPYKMGGTIRSLNDLSPQDRNNLLHMHNWLACGRRVFCVTEGLTQALMVTDFKVQSGDIRLPFPSVFMRWAGTGLNVFCDIDGSNLPLDGAYITQAAGDGALRIMAVSHQIATTQFENGGNYFYVDVPMPREDCEVTHASLTADRRRGQSNQKMSTLMAVWRLAINSLLYISSPDGRQRRQRSAREKLDRKVEKLGPKKRQRVEREGSRSEREYILVGRGVVVQDKSGTGTPLKTRHMVRGHWRNQPWGPKRLLRRMKWIEPHWRGPDTAEAVHRKYMVTEEEL